MSLFADDYSVNLGRTRQLPAASCQLPTPYHCPAVKWQPLMIDECTEDALQSLVRGNTVLNFYIR